jgi:hypothetical protein
MPEGDSTAGKLKPQSSCLPPRYPFGISFYLNLLLGKWE